MDCQFDFLSRSRPRHPAATNITEDAKRTHLTAHRIVTFCLAALDQRQRRGRRRRRGRRLNGYSSPPACCVCQSPEERREINDCSPPPASPITRQRSQSRRRGGTRRGPPPSSCRRYRRRCRPPPPPPCGKPTAVISFPHAVWRDQVPSGSVNSSHSADGGSIFDLCAASAQACEEVLDAARPAGD